MPTAAYDGGGSLYGYESGSGTADPTYNFA
jgi:hypothetical protein